MKRIVRMRLTAAESVTINQGLDLIDVCAIPVPPSAKEALEVKVPEGLKAAVHRKAWDGYESETLESLMIAFRHGLTVLAQRDAERKGLEQQSPTYHLKVKALGEALDLCKSMQAALHEGATSANPLQGVKEHLRKELEKSQGNAEISKRSTAILNDLNTLSSLVAAANQGCCGRKIVRGVGSSEKCSECPI